MLSGGLLNKSNIAPGSASVFAEVYVGFITEPRNINPLYSYEDSELITALTF